MSEVIKMNTVDRPHEVALIGAIEDAIEDIASGKMTPVEIMGCLDMVSKNIYRDYFIDD